MNGGGILMRAAAKTQRNLVATTISLLATGFLALSLNGCAETYYVETNHPPESRYDIYYGPDYYPYYPYYSYYGGAYYYGY
jgi:hypothetical protein